MDREVLSPGEEKFDRWRKASGLFLGPVVFIVIYLLPLDLSPQAHRLASTLGLVIVYWLTEAIPIPVTALLGALINVLMGVAPAKEVFSPFAHPIVFLFIGSFIMAEAITFQGLDRRFAFAVFSIKWLHQSPVRLLFALGLITAVISMWISNTAATAMMLPIALGVLGVAREMQKGAGFDRKRFETSTMLILAYGASIGGIATPIGTPPNLIGIGMIDELAGVRITFFQWMVFAVPLTAVMFLYLFLALGGLRGFGRAESEGIEGHVASVRTSLGRWKRGEVITALSFLTAVVLWVLPSVATIAMGGDAPLAKFLASRLDEGAVAIGAASLLFIIPLSLGKGEFAISWDRAVRIDWGTILLFGGGLSIGGLMFSTGLAEHIGRSLTGLTGASSLWSITAMAVAFGIILSETTSNTSSASMVIPVMIAIAKSTGVSPVPPALGACLGASFGFMLPVSTPPNAIVYGSGLVPILKMVRKGILFDIGGFFIINAGLLVICPLMGWV